ncbi:MAG: putative photosynthetic complex assembly protein PuhE [Pseudomonadota bacterium]
MLASPWIAALLALFLWWFFTGAILWAVNSREGKFPGPLAYGLPMLAFGIFGYGAAVNDSSVGGAYLGFLAALALWGWIELAFLAGKVTGPNQQPCPQGISEKERFSQAWATIAYHELLLAGALAVLIFWSEGADNRVGLWTFGILFLARVSAKLNLFLGVPRFHTELLPPALSHLPSYFKRARMNLLFPVSVVLLTYGVTSWLDRTNAATDPAEVVRCALMASLTALALLEHLLMVLPIPDDRLWRWMIPATKPNKRLIGEDPHGL